MSVLRHYHLDTSSWAVGVSRQEPQRNEDILKEVTVESIAVRREMLQRFGQVGKINKV